jgi:hypothetical protein
VGYRFRAAFPVFLNWVPAFAGTTANGVPAFAGTTAPGRT